FKKRLAGWLDGADVGSSLTAVLCALRIQGLERIRALAGSEAVDDAVRTVASNLFEVFGNGATGCRSGEDTILLLLTGLPKPELAAESMLQVHEKLEQGVRVKNAEGPPVGIVLRVGMAPWTPNYREEETWLDDSQRALAQVGSGSSQRQAFFSQTMHVLNVDRWRMEADLQDAIRSESLEAYLQPIVEMESGRPMGFEALARWTHPERGFVSPAEFIPVAEASGLVVDLGAHMLRHAVAQLVDLRAAFPKHKDLFVSVNLSAHQLGRDDLLGTIFEVLSNSGLPPQALKLEVTETVLVTGTELARTILEELRAHGVRIALDDFGTGYSSMAYLREFPLDTLKIDRSFVEGAGVDANGEGIIRSIIQLGQDLGLEVIGEGVETEEQAELLQRLTCPLGQGYLWSRPLPPAEVYPWMAARSRV
ncbi:MAG: EAL domain-containing protein, partial [Planctomycetes bacterium]|nr:EAL domain-containing protein [Planctomycetota bacterium]